MDINKLINGPSLSPASLLGKSQHELNPASWMYERVVRSIIDFEEKLDPALEIGARLVSFASSEIIHIDDVGYWGPDIIKFYGKNADGNPVELMQHMSQLSVLLVAVKPLAEPRRIGFVLKEKLKAEDDRSADEQ
ncbi:hypothetical protein FHT70_006010 [Rhizobium sp. BK049]|uniref:DUF6173 family protein n=1 Tax=Rhizobium sp. BK049 TaxID=2587095 RepID=UPI001613E567|nr:hypothetical protein [Rhizobium sp. BK049]